MTVKHPAKFNDLVLEAMADAIKRHHIQGIALDPFAGVGRVHSLETKHLSTVGVELEPEWAAEHPQTICADALDLPFAPETFSAVISSPTYGNRMADHHNAKDGSFRVTYKHTLGRDLHENNSGAMQWGKQYKLFHVKAFIEMFRVLQTRPAPWFVWNVSDHFRKNELVPVSQWHYETLEQMGVTWKESIPVHTPRMRRGAHNEMRDIQEWVYVGRL